MYHYKECGLDNIWLRNGYTLHETPYGEGVSIDDIDGLHTSIGKAIAEASTPLTPAEFRFLRDELDLSQKRLGALWDKGEQTVANYEKEVSPIPRVYDRNLRGLYLESIDEQSNLREMLEALADLDNQLDAIKRDMTFGENEQGEWEPEPLAA